MGTYETIEVTLEGEIAHVTLDRPEKRNAINPRMCSELTAAFTDGLVQKARVVILSGNGGTFCSGMDLEEYFLEPSRTSPEAMGEVRDRLRRALVALHGESVPTIASVEGWATGGGFVLQALCDYTLAAEDASFVLSEINFGVFPAGGAMWTLANTMSRRDAMYYSSTGEEFSGREAADLRAITEAVPSDELQERTSDLAGTLLEKDQLAIEFNKHVLRRVRSMSFEEAFDYETAKVQELQYLQGESGMQEGLEQFESREYKPGEESFDTDG